MKNQPETLAATNKAGHEWSGEQERDGLTTWFLYSDESGNLYQSTEVPAYRIKMDKAKLITLNGKQCISPECI